MWSSFQFQHFKRTLAAIQFKMWHLFWNTLNWAPPIQSVMSSRYNDNAEIKRKSRDRLKRQQIELKTFFPMNWKHSNTKASMNLCKSDDNKCLFGGNIAYSTNDRDEQHNCWMFSVNLNYKRLVFGRKLMRSRTKRWRADSFSSLIIIICIQIEWLNLKSIWKLAIEFYGSQQFSRYSALHLERLVQAKRHIKIYLNYKTAHKYSARFFFIVWPQPM